MPYEESPDRKAGAIPDAAADTTTPSLADIRRYFDTCFGGQSGLLALGVGKGLQRNPATGKPRYEDVPTSWFAYPGDADRAARFAARTATDFDVHVCPYLRPVRKRAKGNATTRTLVHADRDTGELDVGLVQAIPGAWAVASGTAGHAHVYVALSQSVTAETHESLCRALGVHLGGADPAKINDNDYLRPPGSLNHKRTLDGEQPVPVRWLIEPDGQRIDPRELAALLKVTADQVARSGSPTADANSANRHAVESVDLNDYPDVLAALAEVTRDRSKDVARVVGACVDAKLTLAQTRWSVN